MALMKHIHKLKKIKYKNGNAIFFCTLPDCHYKIEAALALGKETLCNQCNESFLMNEYTCRLLRPHCNNCGRKEVKTNNGKKFYINKRSAGVLQELAASDVSNLRDRLDKISGDEEI